MFKSFVSLTSIGELWGSCKALNNCKNKYYKRRRENKGKEVWLARTQQKKEDKHGCYHSSITTPIINK